MKTGAPRLAVVLSHPTQYYSPWFRWLAARTPLHLRVFYLWDFGVAARTDREFGRTVRWDVDLLTGYESEFVPNVARDPGTHRFLGLRNPDLGPRLAAWRPDAVLIFGYAWLSPLRALFWARRRGSPALFRGDSHFLSRRPPGPIRGLPFRWIYRRFSAVTYVGQANRRYFEALGVPEQRLFFAPHAVDAARFDPEDGAVQEAAARVRRELGLPERARIALFAGKLVPIKAPRLLLDAFLDSAPADAALVFLGEGEEKPLLESAARARPGAPVRFLPFANQSEMPSRYLAADLLVLPSRSESWGLAVNEAMHMGLPALVSDHVGCHEDLVSPGQTGWVFRTGERADLARALREAFGELARPGRREALREAVRRRIQNYTYAQASAGLLAALESTAPRNRPPLAA